MYHKYGSFKDRFEFFEKHLSVLKDRNVLEIGCNSGMFAWSLMCYASSLIELEKQEKYYNQAKITLDCLKSKWVGKQVCLLNKSFKEFVLDKDRKPVDALYASYVLYHMSDEEIQLLKETILPFCKAVVIPTRKKERTSQINSLFLNREEAVKKLFVEAGFSVSVDRLDKEGCFILVGTK